LKKPWVEEEKEKHKKHLTRIGVENKEVGGKSSAAQGKKPNDVSF